MINWPAPLAILAEVFLAMLPGGIIGIERTTANKPAGFRTHMPIGRSGGAARGLERCPDSTVQPRCLHRLNRIGSDPCHQAIIAGISFLGAGTIFRPEEATCRRSNDSGVAAAFRRNRNSRGTSAVRAGGRVTLLTLIVLRGVEFLERRINKSTDER